MEPYIVADYACVVGECPRWHPLEQRLYWVDIPRGRLYRYDPAGARHELAADLAGHQIGGFTFQADGTFLLFMERGTIAVWKDGALRRTLLEEVAEERESRWNDVVAAPGGQVFCGSLAIKQGEKVVRGGKLYRLDPDGRLNFLADAVGNANGMGFTLDKRQFYFTDTGARTITRYGYDARTGALDQPKLFHRADDQARPQEGRPDGLAVDAEGHVWSGRFAGGRVVRLSPEGVDGEHILVPARNVTSLAFGGKDLDQIYIVSAGGEDKAKNGPGSGALFRVDCGLRGREEFSSRIRLD